MFYEDILRALQENHVRYLITGGAAVNLHGVPRMTADLDLLVEMTEENLDALARALAESGLKSSIPIELHDLADPSTREMLWKEKNLRALSFQTMKGPGFQEVDIVIGGPVAFDELYEARVNAAAGDLVISIVSLEHLIRIKQDAGREQDQADVESLRKVQAEQQPE